MIIPFQMHKLITDVIQIKKKEEKEIICKILKKLRKKDRKRGKDITET
jgi:hypothetical protein